MNKINLLKKAAGLKIVIFLVLFFSSNLYSQNRNPIDVIINNVISNASFVSQDVPSNVTVGQTSNVSITMKNTSVNTWMTTDGYKLALYDARMNPTGMDVWGINEVPLPYNTAPGNNVTFNFTIRAPYTTGFHGFQWSMKYLDTYFGEITPAVSINVTGGNDVSRDSYQYPPYPTSGALFVNQSVPMTMYPGQKYHVWVTMQNNGNVSWTTDYRLAAYASYHSSTPWSVASIPVSYIIEPGKTVTFEYDVVAPSAEGDYTFEWSMMNGSQYFGEHSRPVTVRVRSYPSETSNGYNSASYVSQTVPLTMKTNRAYKVTVTMTNSGNSTWLPGQYRLVFADPYTSAYPWGINSVELPMSITPGGSIDFNFKVKAPSTPGTYNWQWQMVSSSGAFGDKTSPVTITVTRNQHDD